MKKCFAALLVLLALLTPVLAAQAPDDGAYTVELTMAGGTGKASIASPVEITVSGGEITATLIWSSSNYDRMTVDGVYYYPTATEGGSTFTIPIALDTLMEISAETIAMSQPHDIAYTLYFDSATLRDSGDGCALWAAAAGAVVLLACGAVAAVCIRRRAAK